MPAYSSYRTTLAAYILERVAGVAFETYVARPAQIGLAASMSTTALDLAQFMLAHLASPDTTGPSLLKPATLA